MRRTHSTADPRTTHPPRDQHLVHKSLLLLHHLGHELLLHLFLLLHLLLHRLLLLGEDLVDVTGFRRSRGHELPM